MKLESFALILWAIENSEKSMGGSIGSMPACSPRHLSSNPAWGKLSWKFFLKGIIVALVVSINGTWFVGSSIYSHGSPSMDVSSIRLIFCHAAHVLPSQMSQASPWGNIQTSKRFKRNCIVYSVWSSAMCCKALYDITTLIRNIWWILGVSNNLFVSTL